jgi:uncharacterized protein (UPF0216 family)
MPATGKTYKMGSQTIAPKHTQIYGPAPKGGVYGDKELGKMMDEFNSYVPKIKGLSPNLKTADLTLRDGKNWLYDKEKLSPERELNAASLTESDDSFFRKPHPTNSRILNQAQHAVLQLADAQNQIRILGNNYSKDREIYTLNSLTLAKQELKELRNLLGGSVKK